MPLPPRPPKICDTAWEGVIASQYGLSCDRVKEDWDEDGNRQWTGGYEYTVSSVEWLRCAQVGCPWCRFLAKTFLGKLKHSPQWPFDTMHISVRARPSHPREEEGEVTTTIVINGLVEIFGLRTTEGSCLGRECT
ncbi:hypothetical protein C8Q70DRAFT_1036410 [Cubamyces menziesii]|nr:hypothetical protein C8Q70DRAFT_1036410 [Cubamyces menziesii]